MVDVPSATIWAPKGKPGDQGPVGDKGPVGDQGPVGNPGPDAAAFAAFLVSLANQINSNEGAHLVGYSGDFLNNWLDRFKLPITNVLYSDSPQYAGMTLQEIVDLVPANSKLIVRGIYTTNTTVLVDSKPNIEIEFFPGASLTGVAPWTFKPGYRGVISFGNCVRPIFRYPDIKGLRVGPREGDLVDGDAGIEYIQCVSPKTLWGKVNHVLSWGIIHVGCTNTLVEGMTGAGFTQQSAVGNTDSIGAIVRFCDFSEGGLYGIECEGGNNESVQVYNNKTSKFLNGYMFAQSNKRSAMYNNVAEQCAHGMSVNSSTYEAAGGIDLCNNVLNSCIVDFTLGPARFTNIFGNTALPYIADGYYHVSPGDWACNIVSTTTVNIPPSGLSAFVPGDVHSYNDTLLTVETVTPVTDPIYGTCSQVTYTAAHGLTFGASFKRFTQVSSLHVFLQLNASSEHLQVHNNRCNNFKTFLQVASGTHNALILADNFGTDGGTNIIDAAVGTVLTNSSISMKEGQFVNNLGVLVSGTTPTSILSSLHGDRINLGLAYGKKNSIFTGVNTTCVRVRLSIVNPNVPTGNTILNLNGVDIATILPGSFSAGVTMIQDLVINVAAGNYEFKIADTVGNLTFDSCNVELTLIYK